MAYDHFHDRVRVNVAIPGGGGIVSGMSVGRFGGDVEAFTQQAGARAPSAGRPATGRDLANAVAFLLVRRRRHDLGHRASTSAASPTRAARCPPTP